MQHFFPIQSITSQDSDHPRMNKEIKELNEQK